MKNDSINQSISYKDEKKMFPKFPPSVHSSVHSLFVRLFIHKELETAEILSDMQILCEKVHSPYAKQFPHLLNVMLITPTNNSD